MGLVAMAGGGIPPFAADTTSTGVGSTYPPVPLGSRAWDSSGGEYILLRGTGSTAQHAGSAVVIESSNGTGNAVIQPVAGYTSTAGHSLAVSKAGSTAGVSTANYFWGQVYGPAEAWVGSTAVGAGVHLYVSTAQAGGFSGSSGTDIGAAGVIWGVTTTSSNTSSMVNVFLNYPHFSAT